MDQILKYPFILLVGFVTTYLLTPVVRFLALKFEIVDMPGERRMNKTPIPRGGGIALFIGFHLTCASIFIFPWSPFHSNFNLDWWHHYLLFSFFLLVLGIADDIFDISWFVKLIGQIAVAILAYSFNIRVGRIFYFELPVFIDMIITIIWIVGIINAFNIIDGLDGLAPGLAIIASMGLVGGMLLRHLPGDVLIVLGLTGACIAFLRYNFHPASIFLGDSGSMFIGLTLATVSLSSSSKGTVVASLGISLLALGVPIFDVFLAVWRRSVRSLLYGGIGRSVMHVDTDHLHHRLIRRGLTQRTVAVSLYIINAVLVGVGLLSMVYNSYAFGIFLIAFVIAGYIIVKHLARVELRDSGEAILAGLHRPAPKVLAVISYPVIDVFIMSAALLIVLIFTRYDLADYHAFKNQWINMAPIWIGLPFVFTALTKTYIRVWSRARISDFVILGFTILAGITISIAVSIFAEGGLSRVVLLQGMLYACIVASSMMGVRAFFWIVRDATSIMKEQPEQPDALRKILIYGASVSCMLYLHNESFKRQVRGRKRYIVGLIDDDSNLIDRLVYGFPVLGGIHDLDRIIKNNNINDIIIATGLEDDTRGKLMEYAKKYNLTVTEWSTKEIAIYPENV